jgi:hypothetical protein
MALVKWGLVVCVLLGVAGPSRAATIDFDDLPEVFDDALPSPYAGFDWENFRYYSFDANAGFPTWQAGIASQPNAAYSGGELADQSGVQTPIAGVISRATPFDFMSATLGSILYSTMDITVQGYLGNTLKFSQTVATDNTGADLFAFNFTNIDSVRIFGSDNPNDPCGTFNCSLFALDSVVWQRATVPEPSTLALLGVGLLASLRLRRSRR